MVRPDLKRKLYLYGVVCVWGGGGGGPEGGFSEQFCNRKLKNNTAVWKEVFSCSSNRNTCAYPMHLTLNTFVFASKKRIKALFRGNDFH